MISTFRAIRLLQYAVLICLEATLVHLAGALLTSTSATPLLRWWVLVVVAGSAAAVTAWNEPVRVDRSRVKWITAALAFVVIAWATVAHTGDASLSGAGRGLRRLLDLDDERFLEIYLALGASMWAWWRGAGVIDLGHTELLRLLRRAVIGLALIIGALSLAGIDPGFTRRADGSGVALVVELTTFLLLAFVSLSLTRITETADQSTHGAEWRWLRSSAVSTAAIMFLGLLAIALLADPAGTVLRELVRWVLYTLIVLMAPLIALAVGLVELIRQILPDQAIEIVTPAAVTAVADDTVPAGEQLQVPRALLLLPTVILLLIPVIALLLLIIFARRRRSRPEIEGDEERESIFSWGALRADLAGLLGGLRRPQGEGGLRAALRRLVGADPATRVRRRYVQLLLKGEAAGEHRRPAETPREFTPALLRLPGDGAAITTLTQTYEQARYAPETIDDATAQRADAAWKSLSEA